MKQIASFTINHDVLKKGLYVSRIDGDAITYDIRCAVPNCGTYLDNDGIHTIEHLFATYVRNSVLSDSIIYFGPMGCRTGFYFITRDSISKEQAIELVQDTFQFIADYEGEIPGTKPAECGNYREHSLPKAKAYAADMCAVLKGWTPDKMAYEQ